MGRANFIFKYSYNLRRLLKDDSKQKEEVTKITRLLLEKFVEFAPKKINKIINLCFRFIILYKNTEKIPEIKKHLSDNFKNLIIKLKNMNIKIETPKGNEPKISNSGLMPNYIYEGLDCNETNGEKCTLKDLWKDFKLYDFIIDYYSNHLWGIENLCTKVNIEYNGDPLRLCKNLLKEYGDNKAYRNILKDDIIKYFNINIEEQKDKDNGFKIIESDIINVFNINLILLCIGIDITQDDEERNFIIGLYHQFLIYLVLASININQQEKCHDFIQEKIYMALRYCNC